MNQSPVQSLAGKRVLVTGADGFIGSHVVENLIDAGAEVTAFCMYNSNGELGWLDESETYAAAVSAGRADSILGDIRDPEHVRSAVDGQQIVLHLAALIAIPYSYSAPRSYVDTNITGTLNVLEAARQHGIERLVHTSTSEV
ncbi:MAG: GDP-mannose 4,6-dehydratase, partial [Actinobacteria bacterium]|nr:GDP-mannose 4,6-dehydratase [Actinomycetota bacterium]